MRCPKCGFISFDNVEACLKCKKTIPDTAKNVQGSVYNVAPPAFLKFGVEEEEASVDIPEVDGIEVEEEFEFTDPELDILLEDEDEGEAEPLSMEDGEAAIAFDDEEDLAGEFGEIEAFSEEPSDEDDLVLDLGMMEDGSDEEAAELRTAVAEEGSTLDIPDELADISDLSPPEKTIFDDEPEAEARPASKDSLEDELDFGALEAELADLEPEAAATPKKQKLSLDMDEDLDFELDLGGLSIHDDK